MYPVCRLAARDLLAFRCRSGIRIARHGARCKHLVASLHDRGKDCTRILQSQVGTLATRLGTADDAGLGGKAMAGLAASPTTVGYNGSSTDRARHGPRPTHLAAGRDPVAVKQPSQAPQAVSPLRSRARILADLARVPYEPVHRSILVLDIEGFGGPDRSDPTRAHHRAVLHQLLDWALEAAGLGTQQLEARAALGDGVLLVAGAEIPTARLLHPLIPEFVTSLAEAKGAGISASRLRLRAVVHAGEVVQDTHGHTGHTINHAFRLINAAPVRAALRGDPGADLVVAVSENVWDGIVKHGYAGIDPSGYHAVRIRAKETRARAWLCLPRQPSREAAAPTSLAEQALRAGRQLAG